LDQKRPSDPKRPADELLPLLYDELHQLAQRHMARLMPGQTVQATALVHEVYLKLVGEARIDWATPRDFYIAAARSMRNLLVDRARSRGRLRHGGGAWRVSVDADELVCDSDSEGLLPLDEAISALAEHDARKHEVVLLRFFAGLGMAEVATTMGLSLATVERDWTYAKAWLRRRLSEPAG